MKIYSVTTGFQSVSVAQDLLEIIAGSNRSIRIHQVIIGQSSDYGDSEAEGVQIRFLRYSGSYASGSVGTTGVDRDPYGSDDLPAADAVAERNNTTIAAIGTGQEDILIDDVMNVQAGYNWLPTPELRPDIAGTDAFVVRVVTAPTDALTMCCTVLFEEM
jgi:hypothetical protein